MYLRARVTQESKEHGRHRVERAAIKAATYAMTHPWPPATPFPQARGYLPALAADALVELFAENSAEYRTHVHRASSPRDLAEMVAGLVQAPNLRLIVSPGISASWLQ